MVRKWIRGGAFFLSIIILLVAVFIMFLHTATGKSMMRNKVQSYLQRKWKTEVYIGNIDYRLPNWIALKQVIIFDHKKDTLLSGGRLYIGIKLMPLLSNTVDITGVSLEDINLQCRRSAGDSAFNFQFILDAFAPSGNKAPTKTKEAPMRLSVRQLSLNNVRLGFNDQQQQFYFSAFIGGLTCLPSLLNPQLKTYRFNELVLKNSQVTVLDSSMQQKLPQKSAKSRGDPASLQLALNEMQLHNVFFSYQKPFDKTDYTFQLDSLQIHQASLDLRNQRIITSKIRLSKTAVRLVAWTPARSTTKRPQQSPSTKARNKWLVRVDTISLHQNSFVYTNAALPPAKGLDVQHINLKNISMETRNSSFDSSGFFSDLQALSLLFNDQFNVKHVSAGVRFSDSLLQIQDLVVAINQSQVTTYGDIVWPIKTGGHFTTPPQVLIEKASISFGDLLLIQPELKKQLPITLSPSEKIMFAGNFSGTLQNIRAEQISITTSDHRFQLKGSIHFQMRKGGPEISATLRQLQLKKQLLSKDLLQQLQKEKIRLPDEMLLTGKVKVNAQSLVTDLKLNSAFGQLLIKGSAENIRYPQHVAYNFQLEAQQFETGKWIGLDSVLGKVTGHIFIKGKGIQKNQLMATARLQLSSAVVNGYSYSNIDLQAELAQSAFTIRSGIQAQHLNTDLDLRGRIHPDLFVQGNIHVANADLYRLGLTADSLVYAGNIHVNANYRPPHQINAFIRMDSNQVVISGKQFVTDSVLLTCQAGADSILMIAHAPFIEATLAGNYPINVLSAEVRSIWQKLYPFNIPAPKNNPVHEASLHRTSLDVMITEDSLLRAFLPTLELKEPLTIQGRYNTEQTDTSLSVQLLAPAFRYKNYEGNDWQLTAKAVDSTMLFSLTGPELATATNRITDAQIEGRMQKGLLMVNARVNDSAGKEYYSANVELRKEKEETTISFKDDITLNRNKWKIPSDNLIRIVKQGYIINHLSLENRGQTVNINTKDPQAVSPIDIRIDSFDISNIFNFLSLGDTLGAKGTLNADVSIQQPIGKVPVVTGDIQATDLAMFAIPIGDLRFHSTSTGDSLAMQGGLSGENQLRFNGRIHLKTGDIHLQSSLEKLNTDMVQVLAKDFLTRLSGNITGDLQLQGSLDTLLYTGAIYMDSVVFAVKELNTLYRINKQKLVIDYQDLRFNQFALTDSAGHLLTIQGKATLFSPGEKKLDVNMETKDFMVLNATRRPGTSLYGTGIMDAKVAIKGSVDEPIVEGSAYLQKNSHVHFMSTPKRNVTKTRKDGILFVDIDTLTSRELVISDLLNDSAVARTKFKGLKYNLDLKVDKEAEFSIIIDPSTDDELVLKGDARLNAGLGENGNIGIEGVYNLHSGYYKMNNLLLRGKFLLVKGSSISFNGDPTLAEADVTTEYVIEASPKGLLNYKEDDAAYSQRVPFAVIFMIKGPVTKPALSFDIQLQEGKAVLKSSVKSDVEHALERLRSDVTEMNKQVFSLLLTKRFTGTTADNTLESSNLNANNALKEGVSSFLTEAMNQVADQLIKNVDVDVNMKTYKTADDPISKTDLGVAMSKDLFHDRLVIRIEESFAVGHTTAPAKSGSQYIPDITSTYKLSKDGRFQVKAYQKNEYDAVVQGYFTEVGVNFTIELSYETFRELVRRRKNASNEKK